MRDAPTLLYIDDREEDAELLGLRLMHYGIVLTPAYSGRQALERYNPAEHHAVLIDWNLPDMDGIEVARKLLARHPSCNLAFISGVLTNNCLMEANELGIQQFFEKGLKMEHISGIARMVFEVRTPISVAV